MSTDCFSPPTIARRTYGGKRIDILWISVLGRVFGPDIGGRITRTLENITRGGASHILVDIHWILLTS
jgi:hypothetical protein